MAKLLLFTITGYSLFHLLHDSGYAKDFLGMLIGGLSSWYLIYKKKILDKWIPIGLRKMKPAIDKFKRIIEKLKDV